MGGTREQTSYPLEYNELCLSVQEAAEHVGLLLVQHGLGAAAVQVDTHGLHQLLEAAALVGSRHGEVAWRKIPHGVSLNLDVRYVSLFIGV